MIVTTINGKSFKLGWFAMKNNRFNLPRRELKKALKQSRIVVKVFDSRLASYELFSVIDNNWLSIGCMTFDIEQSNTIRQWALK